MKTFLYMYLPWFLWRRSVWVTTDGERIEQFDPFWRRRRWAEANPEFSHWEPHPAGRSR